jgi:hypothetical protein
MAKSALLVEAKMLERDMEARMKSLGTKASKEALEEAEHVRLQVSTGTIRPSWQPIETCLRARTRVAPGSRSHTISGTHPFCIIIRVSMYRGLCDDMFTFDDFASCPV